MSNSQSLGASGIPTYPSIAALSVETGTVTPGVVAAVEQPFQILLALPVIPPAVTPAAQSTSSTGKITYWIPQVMPPGGIDQLTGDVLAGPGTGSQVATVVQAQGGAITFATSGTIGFAAADTAPGLLSATQTSNSPTVALTIAAQSAYASGTGANAVGASLELAPGSGATTNGTPGSVIVALPAPTGSGVEGAFGVTRGGNALFSVEAYPGAPTAGVIWLGEQTNSVLNYTLTNNPGVATYINASQTGILLSDTVEQVRWGQFYVSFFEGASTSLGGGVQVIAIGNAATQPTSAPSGGIILTSNAGKMNIYDTAGANSTLSGTALTGQITATTTGGPLTVQSGSGTTTNGAMTLSSGAGTVYGSLGVVASGKVPGTLSLDGPAMTATQAVGGGGSSTLNVLSGSWGFLPVIVNGLVTGQIPICF